MPWEKWIEDNLEHKVVAVYRRYCTWMEYKTPGRACKALSIMDKLRRRRAISNRTEAVDPWISTASEGEGLISSPWDTPCCHGDVSLKVVGNVKIHCHYY